VNWIVDADIRSFFDEIDHEWMIRFREHRIADQRVIRLIRKWLKAGFIEDGKRVPAQRGTPQGAVVSPLLANIYLHYAFDLWVQHWRKQPERGEVIVVPMPMTVWWDLRRSEQRGCFWKICRNGCQSSG
jgi:RNA-directed DNA polymerase